MQKILKWFTPLLALGVAIFIILFLLSINSSKAPTNTEPLVYKSEVVQKKQDEVWLNHFSKTERLGYFYPVNEVYIKVDLDEKITKTTIYKLTASLLDPYQLFCLREELNRHQLKYFFKKDKRGIDLLIYSKEIDKLNSLVQLLKNYQIAASIMPYKEEIQ